MSTLPLLSFNYKGEYQGGPYYDCGGQCLGYVEHWGAQTRSSCAMKCLERTDCVAFTFNCGYDGCSNADPPLCVSGTCPCWGFAADKYGLRDLGGSHVTYTVKWH